MKWSQIPFRYYLQPTNNALFSCCNNGNWIFFSFIGHRNTRFSPKVIIWEWAFHMICFCCNCNMLLLTAALTVFFYSVLLWNRKRPVILLRIYWTESCGKGRDTFLAREFWGVYVKFSVIEARHAKLSAHLEKNVNFESF